MSKNRTKTLEKFILDARKIHGDKYSYKDSIYEKDKVKIKIICKNHGEFLQTPSDHLQGCGCPRCRESKGKRKVAQILDDMKMEYTQQQTFENCIYKAPLKFDFYIPLLRLCIEYNGKQHYKSVPHFGGDEALEQQIIKDNIKKDYCRNNDMSLFIISYRVPFDKIEKFIKMVIDNVSDDCFTELDELFKKDDFGEKGYMLELIH